jgi:hypothetical protein
MAAAVTLVAMVNVDIEAALPLGVTVAGLKLQVAKAGNPVHANDSVELKPAPGVAVTVVVPLLPLATDRDVGLKARLKVGCAPTKMLTAADVEAANTESPLYCAVMLSVPPGSVVVVRVAVPDALSVPVPRAVVPSRNVIVPVGVVDIPEGGATAAVRVTLPPGAMLALLEVSVVVVASRAVAEMTRLTVAEVDAANVASDP